MRLFDLHADTITLCYDHRESFYQNRYHIDFQRASQMFSSWRQILAIYVDDAMCEETARAYTLRCIKYFRDNVTACEPLLRIAKHADDLSLDCPFSALLAIENGKAIGDRLSDIAKLSNLGVIYMTVTWNHSNRMGNGCFSNSNEGLTDFGKQAINEMYRCHMLPDVSHINESGFWDVAEIADGRPFIASHSLSKRVCSHPRNLTDDQFSEICASRGLIGMNLCASHLGEQTFDCFERHLYHFLVLGGASCLALGMDLDGTDIPQEWNGLDAARQLFDYLLRKNYSQTILERIFFENSQSFFMKTLTSKQECIKIGT